MITKYKFKLFFAFLLIFVIIFYEQTYIGPFKLSLWKLPVIMFLLFGAFKYDKKNVLLLSVVFLSLKLLFNLHIFFGISETLNESIYVLVFPITAIYFFNSFKTKVRRLDDLICATCIFFLISSLPFKLGLLQQSRQLDIFEFDEGSVDALMGIFYHMSISSQVFSISTVVLLFCGHLFRRKYVWYGLIGYGLLATYSAYTRTGWIILALGFGMFAFYKFGKAKSMLILAGFSLIVLSFGVSKDSFFYKRLIGESTHTTNENLDINTLTSGRMGIFAASVNNVVEEGPLAILMGIGKDYSKYKNEKILGTALVAHNRIIELFCYGGLLALTIFIYYIIALKKSIFRLQRANRYRILLVTMFFILLLTLLPSHGFNIYSDFLFGLIMARALIEEQIIKSATLYSQI